MSGSRADCDLPQLEANLAQFTLFTAYFIISLIYFLVSMTKGDPIHQIGDKNVLIIVGVSFVFFDFFGSKRKEPTAEDLLKLKATAQK